MNFDKKYSEKLSKNFNISYALHEVGNKKYVLIDISGDKNSVFENKMNDLIDKIETDTKNPINGEFEEILKNYNLPVYVVMSVSDQNREYIYVGPKYCSEKSLYIEMEKNSQKTKENIKISIAHFYVEVIKKNKSWIVTSFYPQKSCRDCQRDKTNGFYKVKNSKVTKRNEIICNNPDWLGEKGNASKRPLSPSRTRQIFGVSNDDVINQEIYLNAESSLFDGPFTIFIEDQQGLQNDSIDNLAISLNDLVFSLQGLTNQLKNVN